MHVAIQRGHEEEYIFQIPLLSSITIGSLNFVIGYVAFKASYVTDWINGTTDMICQFYTCIFATAFINEMKAGRINQHPK